MSEPNQRKTFQKGRFFIGKYYLAMCKELLLK